LIRTYLGSAFFAQAGELQPVGPDDSAAETGAQVER
jgi:hypothetical protein